MVPVATYVFLDLETTGLPVEEMNRTKITELSMVAVKRQHLLRTVAGASPRVQNKLTLCFNPGRLVQPGSTDTTGLCNDLLEHETYFNLNAFTAINSFLNILTKPVCLISQNGHDFDFPILRNHLEKLSVNFSDDLLCADCLHAFYDILAINKSSLSHLEPSELETKEEKDKTITTDSIKHQELNNLDNHLSMQKINETTPKQKRTIRVGLKIVERKKLSNVRRKLYWGEGSKPKESYKLKNIYERVLNRPGIEAHRAENDCILALEISAALPEEFTNWVDLNHCLFADVKPMTIGVRLGE